MVVKATTLSTLAKSPESARACTAKGRFMRQNWLQRSCLGLVKKMQVPDTSVRKKPISKMESPVPSALMAASPHE
jgi:hypothetical protein